MSIFAHLIFSKITIRYTAIMLLFFMYLAPAATSSASKQQPWSASEHQIKAGFLFKFLFLVEWPQITRKNHPPIIIATLGGNPFGTSFQEIAGKSVHGRPLEVRHFKNNLPLTHLGDYDLIFISPDLKESIPLILKNIQGLPVLTVSETAGFLKMGGMINFINNANDRVNFALNRAAAKKAGIKFRSKLLRVAAEVME